MNRNTLFTIAGVAAALLPAEMFFAFGLWFAPGWANGWPVGLSIHEIWPAGMAAVSATMLLTAAVGSGAGVLSTYQHKLGRSLCARVAHVWLAGALAGVAVASTLVFGYFRAAAFDMWPNGYNPRGTPRQQTSPKLNCNSEASMPSRFPGMDPYLEAPGIWPAFQQSFITCCKEVLQPILADRYEARVRQRLYSAQGEHHEHYMEVVRPGEGQLVTLLDMASPANKATDAGRDAFRSTWQKAKEGGANVVEMDFVLEGRPLVDYSRDGLPSWDYAVSVMRASHPERYEIYTSTLDKRLPRFKLPLAADERDAVVDVPTVFRRCYDHGCFADRIDYHTVPECLHAWIADRAYRQWQQDGYPHGRDKEHWYAALALLQPAAPR